MNSENPPLARRVHKAKGVSLMDQYTNQPQSLSNETRILWLADPALWPYLREEEWTTYSRARAPRRGESPRMLVGYSVLAPGAPPARVKGRWREWERRIWWVDTHDPYAACGEAGYPYQAVWTPSIAPGQPSQRPTSEDHAAAHAERREKYPERVGRRFTVEGCALAPPLITAQARVYRSVARRRVLFVTEVQR